MQIISEENYHIYANNFTEVKIKVGEIVKNEVNRSGISKTKIADLIRLSREHFSNILKAEEMEMKYVLQIGKAIRHDFTKDFPELSNLVAEPEVPYETFNLNQLKNELLEIQRKYSQLQEDYIKTLKDLMDCQRQVDLLARRA